MSVATVIASIVAAGVLATVVTLLYRAYSNSVALSQRDAALQVEKERVTAMEAAAAAQRAARAEEFAQRNDQVRTADDAAALLHDEFN